MNRPLLLIVALVTLTIACVQSTNQVSTLVSSTERLPVTLAPDENIVPTDIITPTESPFPTIASTPVIEGLIEPGMYLVGNEEGQIASGIYIGKGSSCYWERLRGLGGTFDDIIANDGPDGQFYVEIKDTDTAFSLSRCAIIPLDRVPAPTDFITPVEPGMYLVGRDIKAGVYQGSGESCYWERLIGLGGDFDDIIANDGPDGQFYVEIKDSDFVFNLKRCPILPLDQVPTQVELLTHLEPGMYLVGRDIKAGVYQGSGESCYWERLRNVAGEFDGIIANDGPEGSFFVEIASTDYAFRINRCAVDLTN